MNLQEWQRQGRNLSKAIDICDRMRKSGLMDVLKEEAPIGQLPPGASPEDICRAFGEIAGYNQALLNIRKAAQSPHQAKEEPEVTFEEEN